MPPLQTLSGKETVRRFERLGWKAVRQILRVEFNRLP